FQPGVGLGLNTPTSGASGLNTASFNLSGFLSHVFPRSIVEAMGNNEVLQIVVFSLFFGAGLAFVKGQGKSSILSVLEELTQVMFRITEYVMWVAPLAVFAAIAATISLYGLGMLVSFGKLIAQFYLGLALL
ncbi:dicarboxylate/amino acid:cation symporter, partial [Pseudomonas sp. P7548]|uniref:dicarboxylate/amino acid:cation symporter n=2 Tax=unclassified Pseudomonas TaxID=196821 RepID=UPI0015C0085C